MMAKKASPGKYVVPPKDGADIEAALAKLEIPKWEEVQKKISTQVPCKK